MAWLLSTFLSSCRTSVPIVTPCHVPRNRCERFEEVCLINVLRAHGFKVPYTCHGPFFAMADGNGFLQPWQCILRGHATHTCLYTILLHCKGETCAITCSSTTRTDMKGIHSIINKGALFATCIEASWLLSYHSYQTIFPLNQEP